MVTDIQIHNLQHSMAADAVHIVKRPDGGSPFWSRTLTFINADGERQDIKLFGPSEESVSLVAFNARVVYGPHEDEDSTPLESAHEVPALQREGSESAA